VIASFAPAHPTCLKAGLNATDPLPVRHHWWEVCVPKAAIEVWDMTVVGALLWAQSAALIDVRLRRTGNAPRANHLEGVWIPEHSLIGHMVGISDLALRMRSS
jgi:hypothetical protein